MARTSKELILRFLTKGADQSCGGGSRGAPGFIRSDNGPEFVAQAVRDWIAVVGAKTAYIEPGSPWENGSCESFNGRFRNKLLNGEVFYSLREAQIIIEEWRKHYNSKRPHSALGYRPPAPETIIPMEPRPIMHKQSTWTRRIGLPRLDLRPHIAAANCAVISPSQTSGHNEISRGVQ